MTEELNSPHAAPDRPEWLSLFPRFRERKVLVIGDMMLDRFIWGAVKRISPEAPVPVVEMERESIQPGGASNVVNNIGALGARASMIGVIGRDEEGRQLRAELEKAGVDISGVVEDDGATSVKTRIVAHSLSQSQQIVRVDRERGQPLTAQALKELQQSASRETETADAVVFSDYAKGVLTRDLVDAVTRTASERGIPVIANPKPRNLDKLRGITAFSVNHTEAEQAVGREITTEEELHRAGQELVERLDVQHVLVTMGARGLALFTRGQGVHWAPAVAVTVYDSAGAGDTVISAFTLALSAGADPKVAADLANIAAGAVVRKMGVATATPEEILHLYREAHAED